MKVFTIWQIIDSTFPTGGFVHSSGLEAAWQHGEIRGSRLFEEFVEVSLTQMAHTTLPFVRATHDDPDQFHALDDLQDSYLINHVANRASRQQGRAFLSTTQKIFPWPEITRFATRCNTDTSPQHWAPMFGGVARTMEISLEDALSIFVFFHLRTIISSAVRLGIVGPFEAGQIQARLGEFAAQLVDNHSAHDLESIAQTAPLLEIWQGNQDRLYSRLFQS